MSSFSLYFHTIRHLRPQQVFRRLWFRWKRPRANETPRPPLRSASAAWVPVARRRPSLLDAGTFSFLNVQGHLADIGWDGDPHEKLWRYNQHYFDDLNAADAAGRESWHRELLARWLVANPPGRGTGWEPYPTSLRIVNWVKWHAAGNPLPEDALQSLAVQARWLAQRIEWHLLGNHLFANAKALVFAGLLFEGPEASRWLRLGLGVIDRELPEQVLADGGHFERSPMYHALFLEDLLDLVNLAQSRTGAIDAAQLAEWRARTSKMLVWQQAICHPDGEIAFFNDAAIGIAPSPAEIADYGGRLGIAAGPMSPVGGQLAIQHLSPSGYVRLADATTVALLDVAPIGPDYLPGHAHADTLSFELSISGERVVVNGGTSRYGSDSVRLQERGTAAHSTAEVDGCNSSEVWSGFRVARRARPMGLAIHREDGAACVTCSHDGYRRLPGRPLHTREWRFAHGRLEVSDHIEGRFIQGIARFHIHPAVAVEETGSSQWMLRLPLSGSEVSLRVLSGEGRLEDGFHAPEFGIRQPARTLAVRFGNQSGDRGHALVEISWSPDH